MPIPFSQWLQQQQASQPNGPQGKVFPIANAQQPRLSMQSPYDNTQSQFSTPQNMHPLGESTGAVDYIPNVLGVAGQIGGGLIGSAVAPGVGTYVGRTLGGGIGQGAGEFIREELRHQPINWGNIAREAGVGGLYGAVPVPGANAELPLLERIGITAAERAGVGAALGAGQTAVEQYGKVPTPRLLSNVGKNAIIGGVTYPLFGGLFDAASAGVQKLAGLTGESIMKQVAVEPEKTESDLVKLATDTSVGHVHADYARQVGIIPEDMQGITTEGLQGSLDRTEEVAGNVEGKLQKILEKSDVRIGLQDNVPGTNQTLLQITESVKDPNITPTTATGNQLYNRIMNTISDNADKDGKIDLTTLNEIKRTVGEYYDTDRGSIPYLYSQFKKAVEIGSGNDTGVTKLNDEAYRLMEIKGNLNKLIDKPTLPAKLTPNAISDAIERAKSGDSKGLSAISTIISFLGLAGFLATQKNLGLAGVVGGISLTFGLRYTINSALQVVFENPEMRQMLAEKLINLGNSPAARGNEKLISDALAKLGVQWAVKRFGNAK